MRGLNYILAFDSLIRAPSLTIATRVTLVVFLVDRCRHFAELINTPSPLARGGALNARPTLIFSPEWLPIRVIFFHVSFSP